MRDEERGDPLLWDRKGDCGHENGDRRAAEFGGDTSRARTMLDMNPADSATSRVRPIDLTPETVCSPRLLEEGSGGAGSTWALLTMLIPGWRTKPGYSGAGCDLEDIERTVR